MQDSNSSIETQVLGRFRSLPIQLQKQVLDFIEALWLWWDTQRQKSEQKNESSNAQILTNDCSPSFLELTQEFAGCLEGGPHDLSTNKAYLEKLGME